MAKKISARKIQTSRCEKKVIKNQLDKLTEKSSVKLSFNFGRLLSTKEMALRKSVSMLKKHLIAR